MHPSFVAKGQSCNKFYCISRCLDVQIQPFTGCIPQQYNAIIRVFNVLCHWGARVIFWALDRRHNSVVCKKECKLFLYHIGDHTHTHHIIMHLSFFAFAPVVCDWCYVQKGVDVMNNGFWPEQGPIIKQPSRTEEQVSMLLVWWKKNHVLCNIQYQHIVQNTVRNTLSIRDIYMVIELLCACDLWWNRVREEQAVNLALYSYHIYHRWSLISWLSGS